MDDMKQNPERIMKGDYRMKKFYQFSLDGNEEEDITLRELGTSFASVNKKNEYMARTSGELEYGHGKYGEFVLSGCISKEDFFEKGYSIEDIEDWNIEISYSEAYEVYDQVDVDFTVRENETGTMLVFPLMMSRYHSYYLPGIDPSAFEAEEIDENIKEFTRILYSSNRKDLFHATMIMDYAFSPFVSRITAQKFLAANMKGLFLFGLQHYVDYIGISVKPEDTFFKQSLIANNFTPLREGSNVFASLMENE